MRPFAKLAALFLLALTACPTTPSAPPVPPAELVLRGGAVFTAVQGAKLAEAIAVSGGRIAFVGSDAAAAAHIGKTTRVVELAGKFLMPGIVRSEERRVGKEC